MAHAQCAARHPIFCRWLKTLAHVDLPRKRPEECVPGSVGKVSPYFEGTDPFLALFLLEYIVLQQFLATSPNWGSNTKENESNKITSHGMHNMAWCIRCRSHAEDLPKHL